jgi:hypothetical protein
MATNTIGLGDRYFRLARAGAIRNWLDAVIELFTNADDANKLSKSRNILISIDQTGTLLRVCDFGKGMNAQQLRDNLLTIGNNDDIENTDSRGFFRRGARDVTALGDITFDSFQGEKWSQLVIRSDLTFAFAAEDKNITDAPIVVQEWHARAPEQCGTIVSLQMMPVHRVMLSREECGSSLTNLFQLRFAMADESREVKFQFGDNEQSLDLLRYVFPVSMRVFDAKRFIVPGYEQFQAVFELFVVDVPITQSTDFRTVQSGVCVRSANTCYEMTYFDSRLQYDRVSSQYFYGFLTTESIHAMLVDYDLHGPSEANPMLIVDPGRGHGVNIDHPFIKALYSIPQVYLRLAIEERSSTTEYTSEFKDNDQLNEISGLELVASQFINTESPRFFRYNAYMNSLALVVADIDRQYTISALKVHTDVKVQASNATTIESSSSEIPLFASTQEMMENNIKTLKQRYGDFVEEPQLADSHVSTEEKTPPLSVKVSFEENDRELDREYRVSYALSNLTIKINLLNIKVATYYHFAAQSADDAVPRIAKKDPIRSPEYLKHLVTDAIAWLCINEKQNNGDSSSLRVMGEFLEAKTKVHAAFLTTTTTATRSV